MPLDGITAKMLSLELSKELIGARIDKIFQPDAYDIFIRLRNDNQNYVLIASANPSTARIHLTSDAIDNPMVPLRFCTVLRKYLTGGRIISIETPVYERIFLIKIQTTNEIGDKDIKTLVVEIMGRYSNVILLNESMRIIDCALHVDDKTSRVREVLPARQYLFPPSQNKMTPEETKISIESDSFFPSEDSPEGTEFIDKFLLNKITGISPLFVNELCFLSNVNPKERVLSLTIKDKASLSNVIVDNINKIINADFIPSLFYDSTDTFSPSDFHAFALHTYPFRKDSNSISEAMDIFYSRKAKQNTLAQKKSYLVKLVSQKQSLLLKKLQIHRADIEECKNKEDYKQFGNLILSYLHLIKQNDSEITVQDYYDENLADITIPLQSNITGAQNAQKYYKKYNKLKSKFETVSKFIEDEIIELEYFKSIEVSLSNVDSTNDIELIKEELLIWDENFNKNAKNKTRSNSNGKPKKQNSKKLATQLPRKFVSSDGFEIIVGRNNIQNDSITTKDSKKEDIWFHIQKAPGTHVIIKTNKIIPPEKTIEEAAMLAAWYSKANESAINTKAVIDYCPVRNVWKPKKSTPGHVLYRDYESILVKTIMPTDIKQLN